MFPFIALCKSTFSSFLHHSSVLTTISVTQMHPLRILCVLVLAISVCANDRRYVSDTKAFAECVRQVCKPLNRLLHPDMVDAILPWITSGVNEGVPTCGRYPKDTGAEEWMSKRTVKDSILSFDAKATAYGVVHGYTDWHVAQRADLKPNEREMYLSLLRLDEVKASNALILSLSYCSRAERDEL